MRVDTGVVHAFMQVGMCVCTVNVYMKMEVCVQKYIYLLRIIPKGVLVDEAI